MLVRRAFVLVVLGALCLCGCGDGSGVGAKSAKSGKSDRVLSLEDGRKEALKFPTGSDFDGGWSGEVNNVAVCEFFIRGTADAPSLSTLLSNAVEPEGNLPMSIRGLHFSLGRSDGELHSKFIDLAAPFEAEFLEMMGKGTFDFDYDYVSSAVAGVYDACDDIMLW